ncbi:hypothetical protein [Clostridium gasigenes]|uniref:hypothetical protein n=1 Tax=Clostridium gasigenes TaxID=94869 RepID=UPI001A9A8D5C|nr:hypothetical protein [Clostridium gasigenes]
MNTSSLVLVEVHLNIQLNKLITISLLNCISSKYDSKAIKGLIWSLIFAMKKAGFIIEVVINRFKVRRKCSFKIE